MSYRNCSCWMLFFLFTFGIVVAQTEMDVYELQKMSRAELEALPFERKVEAVTVWASYGIDEYSQEFKDLKREIAADPEATVPVLIRLLEGVERSARAGTIVTYLGALSGQVKDKEPTRRLFEQILTKELTFPDDDPRGPVRVLKNAAKSIRYFGDASDMEMLMPLLSHEDNSVRVLAVQSLGLIGDLETAEQIESVLAERGEGLSAEEKQADGVFKFGAIALEEIRKRHPAPESESAAEMDSPSDPLTAIEQVSDPQPYTEEPAVQNAVLEDLETSNNRVYLIGGILVTALGLLLFWKIRS